jgi:hypothetical protein
VLDSYVNASNELSESLGRASRLAQRLAASGRESFTETELSEVQTVNREVIEALDAWQLSAEAMTTEAGRQKKTSPSASRSTSKSLTHG